MGKLALFLGVFAAAIGLALLCAWPTVWIVNYLFTAKLLSYVFGTAKIGFWQAFCMDVLFAGWFKSTASSKS